MKFDVKCVRQFLFENGFVFTVRGYLYNNNNFIFNDKKYKRILITQIRWPNDLDNFYKYSGFKSTNNWWNKILVFCSKDKYLYLILKEIK